MRALGWLGLMGFGASGLGLQAQVIPVPNGSFEDPSVAFVGLEVGPWRRTEKPDWYDEGGGMYWNQLVGVFANTAPGKADHISNLDGKQAAWLFALPGAGIWQEIGPEGSANPVRFEPGRAYQLSVDVLGNGGGMKEGVPLEVGFCHVKPDGTRVPVATRTIQSSPGLFPIRTRMTSFRVTTPVVRAGDEWAGKPVGILAISTVSMEMQGGYWDIDHFQVGTVTSPELSIRVTELGLRLGWGTALGWRYQAWQSADLVEWKPLTGAMEGTGAAADVTVPGDGALQGFYRVEVFAGE